MSRWQSYLCAAAVSAGVLLGLCAISPATAKAAPLPKEKKAKVEKLPPGADPRFYGAIVQVKKRGHRTQVPDYIGHDMGLVNVNMPRLAAFRVSTSDDTRAMYVIDELRNDTVLLMSQASGRPLVYVTNPAGVLKKAAVITTGRWNSRTLHLISVTGLEDAFKTEQEFWIKVLSSTGDPQESTLADPAK